MTGCRRRHLRFDVHVPDETSTLVGHVRSVAVAPSSIAGDGRTVEVQLVRWDEPATVSDDGRVWYTETFARGGLVVPPGRRVVVRNEHDPATMAQLGIEAVGQGTDPTRHGAVVGVLASTHVRSDGLYGTIRLADNDDGRRIRGLIPDVIDRLSVEFDDDWRPVRPGEQVVRTRAQLAELVFSLNPQRGDARVLAVRSHTQETTMDEETTETAPPEQPAEPAAVAPPAPAPAAPAGPPPAATTTQVRSTPRPGPAGAVGDDAGALRLLNSFPTFGHYVHHVAGLRQSDVIERHVRSLHVGVEAAARMQRFRRAFEVAVGTDITGLLPPTWLTEIIDLRRSLNPTVENWSRGPLPDSGETVTQPAVADRPLVAPQAAQLDEPASNKVTIVPVSWTVGTFAGGQGMSIQSILRSTPDYLAQVMRLYVAEMERAFNVAVATGLLAAADDVNTSPLEYTTAQAFPDLIVDASVVLLSHLGRPAEVIGLSIPLWSALAKAKVIQTSVTDEDPAVTTETTTSAYMFPDINPMNTMGTIDVTSPTGQMRRVGYYVEPAWGTENIRAVIGVRDAYRSMEGPMGTMNADDPDTLSRQMAVFKFGTHGKADARGLVLVTNATP